jgi:adenylate cyclase
MSRGRLVASPRTRSGREPRPGAIARPQHRRRAALGIEIERKFLVRDRSVLRGVAGVSYRQGYLSTDPERTVRVRRAGERGYVTFKGISHGPARAEFEYSIPAEDADAMLDALALRPIVEKTRYVVESGGRRWEIDVFEGVNEGLVVAEVELESAEASVEVPAWAGNEVTDDPRYFNANLVAHPYSEWRER